MEIDILTDIAAFLAKPSTQAVTLGICLVAIFVAMPMMQRKVGAQLLSSQRAHFDRLARDVRMQLWGQYAGFSLCTLAALHTRSTAFVSGDIFPSICLGTGITALWNLRKSVVAITNAQPHSNRNRNARLADVYAVSLRVYSRALIPLIYSAIVILLMIVAPSVIPPWLWFLSFLLTGPALNALGWSIMADQVSGKYENNPKLGRATRKSRRLQY